jgi:DNA-binding transcriptional LysR family regulator
MDLQSVDLNLLVTFDAVMSERSVSRAADRLGLTQPAVSHALTRLRAVFRDELFVRAPHGVAPTSRAVEITAVVAPALAELEAVIGQDWTFVPARSERRFTIHLSDYVAPFLLPRLCARLRAEAPGVRLDVRHVGAPTSAVGPGELHVGMASDDPTGASEPGSTVTRAESILRDQYVVLMNRSHPAAAGGLTLDEYLSLAHIKVIPEALGTNRIDDALDRAGLSRKIAMTVPTWFEIPKVVATSDLVVAMPARWATMPGIAESCAWHPLPVPGVECEVVMSWRARDDRDPGQRWMRALIAAVI